MKNIECMVFDLNSITGRSYGAYYFLFLLFYKQVVPSELFPVANIITIKSADQKIVNF